MDSKEDQKPTRENIMKYILLSILIIQFVSVMILFSLSNPVLVKHLNSIQLVNVS